MGRVFLGLGSNDRADLLLPWAVGVLCSRFHPLELARPWRGADVQGRGGAYANWVCAFHDGGGLAELQKWCRQLEYDGGSRTESRVPLDLDILFHEASGAWHRQALEPYWLAGLAELAPGLMPQGGKSLSELWVSCQKPAELRPWQPEFCQSDRAQRCPLSAP